MSTVAATTPGAAPAGLKGVGEQVWRAASSSLGARLTAPALFLVVWHFGSGFMDSILLPDPVSVFRKMWRFAVDGMVVEQFTISISRLLTGFFFVVVVGTVVGVAMGIFKHVDAYFNDILVVGITFPNIIWALLLTMWIGYGSGAPIWVVMVAATPYIATNVSTGVKDVSKELLDMARSYQVSRGTILRHLVLPSLGPYFFAALRYALSTGWKGMIVGEVFASQSGAGWFLTDIRRHADAAGIVAWGLYFGIFAIIVERLIFQRLAKRAFRWRPVESGRSAEAAT